MSRMLMAAILAVLLLAFLTPACGPHFDWPAIHRGRVASLRQRASFDLQCPEPQPHLTNLGDARVHGGFEFYFQYGVTGCDARAVYVDANQNINITRANWVADTQTRSRPSPP